MRRILLSIVVIMISSASICAQNGLAINSLFDGRFHNDTNASENIIIGSKSLADYDLTVYHGLTLSDKSDCIADIEKAVMADGSDALSREVSYRNGHLYYGFYALKPLKKKNRYIFYLNRCLSGGDKAVIIYLEGTASMNQVKSMLKK